MMSCYKRADLLSFRIVRQVRGVVVSVKERCSGMKIIPLCIVMVLLALGSLFHVSSTEPGRVGLRMLRGIKATSTSGATAQVCTSFHWEIVGTRLEQTTKTYKNHIHFILLSEEHH
ncbi:unnamed protein product [Urochloa decumbens]|uniref:Uncharacterized protein n=1 Tax=Urochloa decumbens TaxID=240449 RepID=A0ABC8VYC8_9POAL